jgi:chromosome segregation ATPase
MSDSMSAIDVAYVETTTDIENRTTEQLTAEINVRYRQAESLAGMSLRMLADAGMRLIEVKNRIPHGEFEDWCAEHLEFSKSKAEKMMKLADRMADEESLFSKTETFTDIGISRVWALLAAPEEVAAEIIETHDVTDMTVRELKEEITRLKAEKADAEERADRAELAVRSPDAEKLEDAQNAIERLSEKLRQEEDAKKELEAAADQNEERLKAAEKEIDSLASANRSVAEKLDKAKADLKKQKEKLKELESAKDEEIQKRITEAGAEIEEKARADAQKEAENALKEKTEAIQALREQVSALEAEKAKLSNTALLEFKAYVDQLQDIYDKLNDMITEESLADEELGSKMRTALQTVVGRWRP